MNEVTTNPLADALATLVRRSGSVHEAQTSYIALALADIRTADKREDMADTMIADMCATAKCVSSKGKANPNALKANGHAALAETARILKKVAKAYDGNVDVQLAVDGFLGVVADEAHYAAELAAFPAMLKAGDDETLQGKAERSFRKAYLDRMYPGRPGSFSALRAALDKATKKAGTDVTASAEPEGGEGEGGDVTAAATVLGLAELAAAVMARLGEADDALILQLQEAIDAEIATRSASDDESRKAA